MAIGRLYQWGDEKLIGEVDYQFFDESPGSWWGELIFTEYRKISGGNGYVLELADGRRGRCSLSKKINKAVTGFPTLFYYLFRGSEILK